MCGTKCFAPLGTKELDCITSWDPGPALEHNNDALWEHVLPCLFRGSWSLLKRKGRQEHGWWPTVHTLSPFTSLLSETGAHVLVSHALACQELWKPRCRAAFQVSRPNSQLLSKVIHKILTQGRHQPPPKGPSPGDTLRDKPICTHPLQRMWTETLLGSKVVLLVVQFLHQSRVAMCNT